MSSKEMYKTIIKFSIDFVKWNAHYFSKYCDWVFCLVGFFPLKCHRTGCDLPHSRWEFFSDID